MNEEQFKQLMDKLESLQRAIDAGRVIFTQPIPQPLQPWNPAEPWQPSWPRDGGARD